ncbi:MAG: flavin reductase family protein [Candidatus Bipolaricaulota bacterium]
MNGQVPWLGFDKVQEQIGGNGAFLIGQAPGGKPNPMTIGWGFGGTCWGRAVFLVLVRPSRYTHGLIEESREFSVSIPAGGLEEELAVCGSKSGREVDKIGELGLEIVPGTKAQVPTLGVPGVHYECRVVAKTRLSEGGLVSVELRERYYPGGDLHTLYFGEVLAVHRR